MKKQAKFKRSRNVASRWKNGCCLLNLQDGNIILPILKITKK
jgi:hypothetical protein